MMPIITTTGQAKLAAALATNGAVNIHEIALGSSARFPTGGEAALETEVYRDLVSARGIVNGEPNTAFFRISVPEDGVDPGKDYGPWIAQEYGLFDDEGDLIVIGRLPEPQPKNDPAATPNAIDLDVHVVFDHLEAINLTYNPNFNLPWADEPQAEDEAVEQRIIDPKRLWHVLGGKFVQILQANLDVTVDAAGGADFLTIQEAVDHLDRYRIPPGITATITVAAGDYAPFTVQHPDGAQVRIKGAALTGSFPAQAQSDASPATTRANVGGRIPTKVTCPAKSGAVITGSIGLIENLWFDMTGAPASAVSAVHCIGGIAKIERIAATGFTVSGSGAGFTSTRARINANELFAAHCDIGARSQDVSQIDIGLNGETSYFGRGVRALDARNGVIEARNVQLLDNSQAGVMTDGRSSDVILEVATFQNNNRNAMTYGGGIRIKTGALNAPILANNSAWAANLGFIWIEAAVTGNKTFVETQGGKVRVD